MLVEPKTGIHYCWKWKAPRVRCWNIRIFRTFFRRNECKWPHQQNMTNIALIIPASTVIHRLKVIQFACFVLRNKQHILKCRSNAKVREYSKSANENKCVLFPCCGVSQFNQAENTIGLSIHAQARFGREEKKLCGCCCF